MHTCLLFVGRVVVVVEGMAGLWGLVWQTQFVVRKWLLK